jgi:hypothetical protein
VQLRLHEGLAAVVAAADPTTTHELLQNIAKVSQLITQVLVVDDSGSNCGCGAGCTTICASLIRSVSPNATELLATTNMHNGRTYRMKLPVCARRIASISTPRGALGHERHMFIPCCNDQRALSIGHGTSPFIGQTSGRRHTRSRFLNWPNEIRAFTNKV